MTDSPKTVLPPLPGGLTSWSDEAKVFYLNLRARGVGLDSAYGQARDAFGSGAEGLTTWGAKRPGTLVKWESREAADYLAALRAELKADYSKLAFSQKFERVAILGNMVLALYARFEAEDRKGDEATHTVLTALASETRQVMKEIHSHVEGAGLDDARVLSLWETVEKRRREIAARGSDRAAALLEN